MNDVPLGFGVAAQSTAYVKELDPTANVILHQVGKPWPPPAMGKHAAAPPLSPALLVTRRRHRFRLSADPVYPRLLGANTSPRTCSATSASTCASRTRCFRAGIRYAYISIYYFVRFLYRELGRHSGPTQPEPAGSLICKSDPLSPGGLDRRPSKSGTLPRCSARFEQNVPDHQNRKVLLRQTIKTGRWSYCFVKPSKRVSGPPLACASRQDCP